MIALPLKLSEELDSLKHSLHQRGYPFDKYINYRFLAQLEPVEPLDPKFETLLNEVYRRTVGGRTKQAAEELKRHWGYFLLGLSGSVLMHKWLAVRMAKSVYSMDNPEQRRINLKYNATSRIIEFLEKEGLAIVLKGDLSNEEPKLVRVYPTPDFAALILPFYLRSREPFHGGHMQMGAEASPLAPQASGKEIKDYVESRVESKGLLRINEFLKGRQWACAGPVLLKAKKVSLGGSPLYTRFQELDDGQHKIRVNTLIDDEPIYEMKFDAHFLRLVMAVLHQEDIGDTPYEDIMWLADTQDRGLVKFFIKIAMGTRSRNQALSRWCLNSQGKEDFRKIESAINKLFPSLKLFEDWGDQAQGLEAAILIEIMLAGIEKDIVAIPVDGSVAVQQRNESWAADAMFECWDKFVGQGKARLKVERP